MRARASALAFGVNVRSIPRKLAISSVLCQKPVAKPAR